MKYLFDNNNARGFEKINGTAYPYKEQNMQNVSSAFQSRRFMTMLFDVVISLVLFFGSKYAGIYIDDIRFVIITLQPIFLWLIANYTYENVQVART